VLDSTSPLHSADPFGHDGTLVTHTVDRMGVSLSVRGEIDLATAPGLARRIREALCLPVSRITVDLSEVEFMDSQGLHVLEDARLAAEERHVDLVLAAPTRCVRRLLDVTSTTDQFDIRAR
jgi:anti-sigma B factor antagonist